MTKRIFKGILCTALATMVLCLVFIIGVQYQYYEQSQLSSLKSEASIIANTLSNGTAIETFEECEERITLISSNGEVIYDNKFNSTDLDNHLNRKEIKDVIKNGEGSATRFSETISDRTCYYAVRLQDGNILRLSSNRSSLFTVILSLMPPICAIILSTAVIALILASIISKKILKPINSIDPDNPEINNGYEELYPLVKKLRYQKRKINKQIAELTQSRREFEIISENMSEGMILTDTEGIILTHNKSSHRLLNVTDKINGKPLINLNRSEAFRNIYGNILEAKHYEDFLYENERCCEIITNPVLDEDGIHCGAVVLIIDVTERQEREKLRREFTANVSHELKTPLTSILGFSDMLKSGIIPENQARDCGNDIYRETKRLISLINDIIKLSSLDEGATNIESEAIDLLSVSKEVREKLKPLAETNCISITVEGEAAEIKASDSLIFELVYNLCENAVKYNRENGKVIIKVGKKDNHSFVTVKDTGIGIAPEHIDRIFERFYRVDKSRSNNKGGTGLGLSIVKHITKICGGIIKVESKLNVGTQITVIFNNS